MKKKENSSRVKKFFSKKSVLITLMVISTIFMMFFIVAGIGFGDDYLIIENGVICFIYVMFIISAFIFYKCLNKLKYNDDNKKMFLIISIILFILISVIFGPNLLGDNFFEYNNKKCILYSYITFVLFILFVFISMFNFKNKKYKYSRIIILCLFLGVSLFLPCRNNKMIFKLVNDDFNDYRLYVDFIDSYNSSLNKSYSYLISYDSNLLMNNLLEKDDKGYYKHTLSLYTDNYNESDFLKLYNHFLVKENDYTEHFVDYLDINNLNQNNFYCTKDSKYLPVVNLRFSYIDNYYVLNDGYYNLIYYTRVNNLIIPNYKTSNYEIFDMFASDIDNGSIVNNIKLNGTTISLSNVSILTFSTKYLTIYLDEEDFDSIKVENGTLEIYDQNNVPKTTGNFVAGDIIKVTTDLNQEFYMQVGGSDY